MKMSNLLAIAGLALLSIGSAEAGNPCGFGSVSSINRRVSYQKQHERFGYGHSVRGAGR